MIGQEAYPLLQEATTQVYPIAGAQSILALMRDILQEYPTVLTGLTAMPSL